ncbi:hypothetical protein K1W69_20960 [Hoeflea sp. WL0058]|uniref:DUF945 domain-containing protein n=1 Tax=Flavimaribacter sediminis TaxID=2865987 RepID=A0AAE2ZU70_9HYPH|nr:hypothetical protein [Flavimaribacter sediminis]MBW8639677.1 hypothetical protein [Flavimaribacter sediminis]
MLAQHLRTGLLAGLVVFAPITVAGAVEADQFAEKLFGYYDQNGYEITYSGAESTGDSVTISDIAFKLPETDETIDLGDLTFRGVSEDGKGGYNVSEVEPFDFSVSIKEAGENPIDIDVSIDDIKTTGLHVPANPDMSSAENLMTYDKSSTGAIDVKAAGATVFSAQTSSASNPAPGPDNTINFTFDLDGMMIDLSGVEDQDARKTLDALGYTKLTGGLSANGSWNLDDGTLSIDQYVTDVDGAGKLDLKASVSGVTLEFVQGLQEMQAQMAQMGDDAKAEQAMGMAMMGMMQQLTFNDLTLRFDDQSLTGKILEMAAAQQGMSADQLVQSISGMLPIMLAQIKNPDFQQNVSTAVSAYLANPENIEISATPPSPLPFASIMGAGIGSPESLPTLLNVQVKANQ